MRRQCKKTNVRLAWYQVSEEQLIRYSELVGRLLDVSIPAEAAICCELGTCEHVSAIEKYYNDIFFCNFYSR